MPIKPTNKHYTCTQKILNIINDSHSLEDDAIDAIKEGFEDSADFRFVYRNADDSKLLKSWITDGTTDDKLLGYKRLFSYPYIPIAFNKGDYIHFDYYHVGENNRKQWATWLMYALDYQNYYNVAARLYPCNEQMKWFDNKNIIKSYPCYLEDSMKYTTLNLGQNGFTEADGDVIVFIQDNADTEKLYINQRFLLANRAWIIVQKAPEISNNVIKLFLNKVQEQPEDDFENGIAWNGKEVIPPVKPIGKKELLLPNIDTILMGDATPFNIYTYVDEVKQNDTYDITISGINNIYYKLTIIDGNNFTIENLKQYKQNPLTIKCENKITHTIVKKDIWLGGAF